jgi:hypothetical protein
MSTLYLIVRFISVIKHKTNIKQIINKRKICLITKGKTKDYLPQLSNVGGKDY